MEGAPRIHLDDAMEIAEKDGDRYQNDMGRVAPKVSGKFCDFGEEHPEQEQLQASSM